MSVRPSASTPSVRTQKRGQAVRGQQFIHRARGKKREDADGLKQFARHLGQAPEGIEQELDDPERENAEPREAQQPRPGLFVDQL